MLKRFCIVRCYYFFYKVGNQVYQMYRRTGWVHWVHPLYLFFMFSFYWQKKIDVELNLISINNATQAGSAGHLIQEVKFLGCTVIFGKILIFLIGLTSYNSNNYKGFIAY